MEFPCFVLKENIKELIQCPYMYYKCAVLTSRREEVVGFGRKKVGSTV